MDTQLQVTQYSDASEDSDKFQGLEQHANPNSSHEEVDKPQNTDAMATPCEDSKEGRTGQCTHNAREIPSMFPK